MRPYVASLLLIAGSAHADIANRNLFPIGEHEALRANAGIAGSSPGSVFHNPAGLARMEHSELSASGSTYMYFRTSTDRLIELDEPVPYEMSGFAPIPASVVTTYQFGDYGLATAILVPDMFTVDNRQRHMTPAARLDLQQSVRRQDLWLGGCISRRLGDYVSVGLSLFGIRRTAIANSMVLITTPSGTINQNVSSESSSIIGATAILGVSVDVAPWLTVGARIEPPFVQITGDADIYRSQLAYDGMTTQLAEVDVQDVSIRQPVPADFGLGFAITPSDVVTIYVDAALQLPARYTYVDAPALGPPTVVSLEPAPRGSLGADVHITEKLTIRGGAHYNRSALRRLEQAGDSREDFWGGTLGLTWASTRTRTSVGAMVLRSDSAIVPGGAMPGDTEPAATTILSGLLSVAYLL